MSKEENVLKYYILCSKLKNVIRTGWKDWHVNRQRVESVAEHIYGTQMLAIAMKSEYGYDVDILKVIFMLAVHELEEIKIGDLTQFQITKEEKLKIGHAAVKEVLSSLADKKAIENYILEFDERKTKEAVFAHLIDKLECDIQCKLYDEEGCVDLTRQEGNDAINDERVKKLIDSGISWSKAWMEFDKHIYEKDENFLNILNYAMNHKLTNKN